MEFYSHKIVNPTGGGPTFEEWTEEFLKKQASEACPEDDESRGAGRCQVINTDNEDGAGYQKGESVTGKPDQAEGSKKESQSDVPEIVEAETKEVEVKTAGKEMGECDAAGKVTEEHSDAASTDPECKQNINNDPNYQKGESVDPSKVDGKNKKSSEKGTTKTATTCKFKKIASMNREEKLGVMSTLFANKNNPKEYVEAMVGLKVADLKKLNNLTDKEKEFLRGIWGILEPDAYVEEMLKDR